MTDANTPHPEETTPALVSDEEILDKLRVFWADGLFDPRTDHLIEAVRAIHAIAESITTSAAWEDLDRAHSSDAYLAVTKASAELQAALGLLGSAPLNFELPPVA